MKDFKLIKLLFYANQLKQWSLRCSTVLLFFLIFFGTCSCVAQNQNNIWCFGDSAGIDFTNILNPLSIVTSMDTRGSCVSISDRSGQILFYAYTRAGMGSFTTQVMNSHHQLMDGGDSIAGRGWYNELLIIPFPDDTSLYYLFSLQLSMNSGVYYSVIDMSENNGLGKVIQKNVLYHNYRPWDAMAAVKHANGRDWWLITKDYDIGGSSGNDLFHINLITPDSISESTQNIGGREFGNAGNMSFTKDGTKFLFTSWNGLIEVMEFDRCLGLFSNAKVLINHVGTPKYFGSAFSPNGDLLYVSTNDIVSDLYQFDLNAVDIFGSKITIGSISDPGVAGGSLRLGPDNKIYWACAWNDGVHFNYPYPDSAYYPSNMNLSVINDPNVVGSGCDLSLYSFYLGGKRTYWGLPNNPDYSLGPVIGSVCDSLTSDIPKISSAIESFYIFPNPARNKLYITQSKSEQIHSVSFFNSLGQLQAVGHNSTNNGEYVEANISDLISGIYYIEILTARQKLVKKFIKE